MVVAAARGRPRADLAILFAFNDASGERLVRAVEVVSGHSGEARMAVIGE